MGVVDHTSFGVRGHLALMSGRGKSARGPVVSRLAERVELEISLITKGFCGLMLPVEGDAWVLVMKYQKQRGRAFEARSMLGSAQCDGWAWRLWSDGTRHAKQMNSI